MNKLNRLATCAVLLLGAGFLTGCGGGDDHAGHGHGHDEAATTSAGGGHVHHAPRGGLLVVLAEETAHVELLLDRGRGRLDAYLLGPHAHTPLKSRQQRIFIELDTGGESLRIPLQARGNLLSGEEPGNTSHFQVQDERLKSLGALSGSLGTVEVLGTRFEGIRFEAER
jgi:hypothetical protein